MRDNGSYKAASNMNSCNIFSNKLDGLNYAIIDYEFYIHE